MNCSGIDALSGQRVDVEFGESIVAVRPNPNAPDVYLAPGFIDLQVNGAYGVDFCSPRTTVEQVATTCAKIQRTGVTRLLPTVITGGQSDMEAALKTLSAAAAQVKAIAGFHVEGPHIGAEDGPRGAHPLEHVRPPSLDEYRRLQDAAEGKIRLLTLSPHWPEAASFIEHVAGDGVTVSIGHTGATAEQIDAAVRAGATMSTHIGNGAHGVVNKRANYIYDQLADDRLMAGMIVDGIHLGSAFLKVAIRAKTVERSVLVTDASAPAGCPPGRYHLGQQVVDLIPDGRVILAGQDRLAGSSLEMHTGVANLMRLGGIGLGDAVRMATVNPARAIRLNGRCRGLIPGETGDLVQFRLVDGQVRVDAVWVGGEAMNSV